MKDCDKSGADLLDDDLERRLRSTDPVEELICQAAIEFARHRHGGKKPRRLLSKKELAVVKNQALKALDERRARRRAEA